MSHGNQASRYMGRLRWRLHVRNFRNSRNDFVMWRIYNNCAGAAREKRIRWLLRLMLLLPLLLLALSVLVLLVNIFFLKLLLASSITIRCSGKERVLPPRRPERYVDVVPGNREPFFWCWPKGSLVCGGLNDCFSSLFVSFDDAVVLLLLLFIYSYKSNKVWSLSTSPRANWLSFTSLGWLHLRHWLPWHEKVLS